MNLHEASQEILRLAKERIKLCELEGEPRVNLEKYQRSLAIMEGWMLGLEPCGFNSETETPPVWEPSDLERQETYG